MYIESPDSLLRDKMLDEEEAGPTGSNAKPLKEKKQPGIKKEKTWKERGEIAPLRIH